MSAGHKNMNGIEIYDRKNGTDVWFAKPNFKMEDADHRPKYLHSTRNVNSGTKRNLVCNIIF